MCVPADKRFRPLIGLVSQSAFSLFFSYSNFILLAKTTLGVFAKFRKGHGAKKINDEKGRSNVSP